jgi:hypothetical protein
MVPRVTVTHNYQISLFYHVGMIDTWLSVVHDQLDTLEWTGLDGPELNNISVNTAL